MIPPDLVLPNITLPSVQLADCDRAVLGIEVEKSKLRPLVPAAFNLTGLAPDVGAVNFEIVQCQRGANDTATFGAFSVVKSYAFVRPTNLSWMEEGYLDYYLLDVASDSDSLEDSLTALGIPNVRATFERTRLDAPGSHSIMHYSIDTAEWDAVADLPWPVTGDEQNATRNFHYWYGENPIERARSRLGAVTHGFVSAGELAIVGDAKTAQAMSSPTHYYTANYWDGSNQILVYDGRWT